MFTYKARSLISSVRRGRCKRRFEFLFGCSPAMVDASWSAVVRFSIRLLNRNQLQLILGAPADFIARKLRGQMLQQVSPQAAFFPGALDQAKAHRKEIFGGEAFLFFKRLKQWIRRAAQICQQFHGRMVSMACHSVRVEFELGQREMKFIFRLELGKFFERYQESNGLFILLCFDEPSALRRELLVSIVPVSL